MCTVLKDVLDKVTWILPAIESARPGYRTGIQELCSINKQLEKGKDIIQHCTEASKLYLVCYFVVCPRSTQVLHTMLHIIVLLPEVTNISCLFFTNSGLICLY
jgi:hypothetical protein